MTGARLVTVGLTANRFELVNTFYVAFDEDRDDVTPVITRAMALLSEHGRTLPTSAPDEYDAIESRPDHLVDIHGAMQGEERVRTQIVLRRLAESNPAEYGDWSFPDLADALAEHRIAARKSHGVMVVHTADLSRALTDRDDDDA